MVTAQTNLYFEQTSESGLFSIVGRSVVCDKNDIVYFGTNDGLYKFNGYGFTKFPSAGLAKNVCPLINIRTLFYDGNLIWLGGPEGFASYNPNEDIFKSYISETEKPLQEKPAVRGFCKINDSIILAATYRSYTILHTTKGIIKNIKLPDTFPKSETSFTVKMVQDDKRNLWIATADDGLYFTTNIYETPQKAEKTFDGLKNFPSPKIIDLITYTNDTLLIGTTTGLYAVNMYDGNWRLITLKSAIDDDTTPYIKKILKLNTNGDLFIATLGNGLFHYLAKENRFQNYVYNAEWYNGLPDNYVNDIAAGSNGVYWMAMEDSWLAMVNTWFSRYEYVLIPPVNEVKSVITVTGIEESGGSYWLTTSDGFMQYDTQKKFSYFGNNYSSYAGEYLQNISKLDEDHFTFIIYGQGVGIFNKNTNTFGYLQAPGENIMSSEPAFDWLSYVDDDKNYFLVDFAGNYLKCNYKKKTIDTLFTPEDIKLPLPIVLPETENTIWILSAARLYYYNIATKTLTKITEDKNGNKLPPVSFQEDLIVRKNGMVYIASADEGFFEYDRNKNLLKRYSTDDGLSTNTCFAVFEDRKHNIFILASNSIASFNEKTKEIKTYPLPRAIGITQPFVDESNNLLIGENACFMKIPMDSLQRYTGKPGLRILSVKAGEKYFTPEEIEKGISIRHKDFPLEIQYELIDYISPNNNKIFYFLQGWDESRVADKNLSFLAYYSKVTAGNYVFQLKGRNAMNSEYVQLEFPIKVIAPYWQTWWFIALLVLSGLLIPFVVYRYRINQLRKIQTMRNEIAADLHDEVGSSLSSIKMLSEIAVMQERNTDTLKKISNNAKESAEKMQDIIWMVNPKNDTTQNMLQRMEKFLYEICSAKNISYEFTNQIPSLKLNMQQRKNVLLVFKEAVNNAAKYANAGNILVSLYQNNNKLILKIEDNGIGFDKQQIEPGNGLDSMQMRANELKGKLDIDSVLHKGTTIIFTLPL